MPTTGSEPVTMAYTADLRLPVRAADEQSNEHSSGALQRRGRNRPPEPLRWAICQLLTAALRFGDAMVDRQIRRFRGAG